MGATRWQPREVLRALAADDRLARATWSRLAEPGDLRALTLVGRLGAGPALEWLVRTDDREHAAYRARMVELDPRPTLDLLHRRGGRLVCPGDEEWPSGLAELEDPPYCLWVQGPLRLDQACARSVSIVGARASTGYGQDMAERLAEGVAERGFTVVSGAAYGIDAAAHRAALASDGRTIAVLAGGIDRAYPAAHAGLLAQIAQVGAVLSEVPPGSASLRNRFLKRNRMIAALTRGTVVVEAALRSGALSTARAARDQGRPVGVVPGLVSSPVSAGCHLAAREGWAVLVTSPGEVAELVGRMGEDLAPRPTGARRADWDDLDDLARAVLDALPRTRGAAAERVALVAGHPVDEVRAALGRLALLGLALHDGVGWRRRRVPSTEQARPQLPEPELPQPELPQLAPAPPEPPPPAQPPQAPPGRLAAMRAAPGPAGAARRGALPDGGG